MLICKIAMLFNKEVHEFSNIKDCIAEEKIDYVVKRTRK